jgi:hypothetical protein
VTGGSFSSAFQEKNLWVYPFLATSGIIYIISNYKEAEKAAEDSGQISSEKLGEQIIEARAIAVKAVRRALASAASSVRSDGAFNESPKTDDYEEPAETLLTLIDDIFNEDRRRPRSSAISAAWRLASLMGKDYIRESVADHTLTQKQLDQPRLTWFIRPGSRPVGPENSLNTIEGRIGYLIREGGIDRIPNSLIALDPYLAAALIAVREPNSPYHTPCQFKVHDNEIHGGDAETISLLTRARGGDSADTTAESSRNPRTLILEYREIGRLIDPNLLHTHRELGTKQAALIQHVMRHFLDDELSAALFDSLSRTNQAQLASAMLNASRWMSPIEWDTGLQLAGTWYTSRD